MANWQNKLDIKDLWKQGLDRTIAPNEFADGVVEAIRAQLTIDDELQDVVEEFEAISHDPDSTWDDTDEPMTMLYDWGDTALDDKWPTKKICWIATAF